MKLKTKSLMRTPKQSLFFFTFIIALILAALIFLFINKGSSSKSNAVAPPTIIINNRNNEDDNNDDDEYYTDNNSITSPPESTTTLPPQSTPIPKNKREPIKPMITKKPSKIEPKKIEKMADYQSAFQNQPVSSNSGNPLQEVDPWNFISFLPAEETRLNSNNRDKTNSYFLEGLSINKNNGPINMNNNSNGTENFSYI